MLQIHRYSLLKNVSSFCNAKATCILSAKNINVFENTLLKTFNELVINELVNLTML